jgi:hypothetical protein
MLPPPLAERLLELRHVLERQGVVQLRPAKGRRAAWRIRYRHEAEGDGHRRHASLPLGSDEMLANAVLQVLEKWRQEYREKQETEAQKRVAELQHARLALQMHRVRRRMIQAAVPGGRVLRQRIGRDYDRAAAAGPLDGALYAWNVPYAYPSRPPGRPRKARLW